MRYEASLQYNEALLRQAVFGFWHRTVGTGFLVVLVAVALGVGTLWRSGDRSWLLGAMAAMLLVALLTATAVYLVHYRNTMRKFRAMPGPQARFIAQPDTFTIDNGTSSASLAWSSVRAVWRLRHCWLLLFSKAEFVTLPLVDVSADMQSYIIERVSATGGVVDGTL
jgi:hypothetical protein